jgi:hypothetical protein
MKSHEQGQVASPFPYEVLTATELSQRLKVKESWIIDQSKPSPDCRSDPDLQAGQASSLPLGFTRA